MAVDLDDAADSGGLLAPAVGAALVALPVHGADAAARRLAEQYAARIDDARRLADEVAAVEPENEGQARRLAVLARQVEAQAVLADLGPKLLAVLDALGATPRARLAAAGAKGGGPGDGPSRTPLDDARDRRARQRHAAAVDAPAPPADAAHRSATPNSARYDATDRAEVSTRAASGVRRQMSGSAPSGPVSSSTTG